MTSADPLPSLCVPKESLDLKTRQTIAANLRRLKYEQKFRSVAAMAKEIGISRGALNRYLKGERTMGLDTVLAVHRKLHASIDWLVDRQPEPEWLDPDYSPAPEPSPRKKK